MLDDVGFLFLLVLMYLCFLFLAFSSKQISVSKFKIDLLDPQILEKKYIMLSPTYNLY